MQINKHLFLISFLVVIIVLSSCQLQTKTSEVTCNKPYIQVGLSCCLDKNSNQICDSDETFKSSNTLDNTPNDENEKITVSQKSTLTQTEDQLVTTQKALTKAIEPVGKYYSHSQGGYNLVIDDYTFEKKTEDYGTLNDLTFILTNQQGSASLMPQLTIIITDKTDSKFTTARDIDLSEWIEDKESIKRTVIVDAGVGEINNTKEFKVVLREWGKLINSVSFDVNLNKNKKLG